MNGSETISIQSTNPWENVYWFARMLIATDKYGAPGKKDKKLLETYSAVSHVLDDSSIEEADKLLICKKTLSEIIGKSVSEKKALQNAAFLEDVCARLNSIEDIHVLLLTIKNVVLPINVALSKVPNSDIDFTKQIAKSYLDTLGTNALANVINIWDDAGTMGCLRAERALVKEAFEKLRFDTQKLDVDSSDWVLTAFIQEFERRLGQKRKNRAGGSLEDVATFLFEYFEVKAHTGPEHFKADLEVDKWFKCKDKWLIGISCKRTLRERWKQVSSADRSVLSSYKIKAIWHLITFDEDLSDDKLASLGAQNHVFYLRDDSMRLASFEKHPVLKNYVRRMSFFIDDIKAEQNK